MSAVYKGLKRFQSLRILDALIHGAKAHRKLCKMSHMTDVVFKEKIQNLRDLGLIRKRLHQPQYYEITYSGVDYYIEAVSQDGYNMGVHDSIIKLKGAFNMTRKGAK